MKPAEYGDALMSDRGPAPGARLFRVFVSSTFADLSLERRALQHQVFRPLMDLCRSQGARFQAVDLRWGVSEAAAGAQTTMAVCLREVRRCRTASPWFHLLALLGDRRGWLPVPAQIPSEDLALIEQLLTRADGRLVAHWYELDRNGLPPVRRLRPWTGIGPARWARIERRLHEVLAAAATACLPAERRSSFLQSAVEQELQSGLFSLDPGTAGAYAVLLSDRSAPGSGGNPQGASDAATAAALKDRVRAALAPERRFEIERVETDVTARARYLDLLASQLRGTLTRDVQAQLDRWSQEDSRAPTRRPGRARPLLPDDSSATLVGRDQELARVTDFLAEPGSGVLAVTGRPGTGKSALLSAAVAALARQQDLTDTGGVAPILLFRALGTDSDSGSAPALVPAMARSLALDLDGSPVAVPAGFADAVRQFGELLGRATPQRPIRLVLDGIDQLSDDGGGRSLAWLPDPLPPHVRVVVSVRTGVFAGDVVGRTGEVVDLSGLSATHGAVLLDRWLAAESRTLTPEQRAHVVSRFAEHGRPLWLRLAVQECRYWRSTDAVMALPADIRGLARDRYRRWSSDVEHGPRLVRSVLGLLSASDAGLSEDELLDALSTDEEVLAEVRERSTPRWRGELDGLPVVLWAQLSSDLQPYLAERGEQGIHLFDFFHRELRDEAARWAGGATDWHARLAELFRSRADPGGEGSWTGRPRPLEQVVTQLELAGDSPGLVATLTDVTYLAQVCRTVDVIRVRFDDGIESRFGGAAWLRRHLLRVLSQACGNADELEQLRAVEHALRLEFDILSRKPSLFRQQVLGRFARSGTPAARALSARALTGAAVAEEEDGLDVLVVPAEPQGLQQVLQAHDRVNDCAISTDGTLLLSGGWDGVARLWDGRSGEWLADLPGHQGRVWCAFAGQDRLLVTVDRAGHARVRRWSGVLAGPLAQGELDLGEVRGVAASSNVLAVAGTEGVRLFSLPGLVPGRQLSARGDATCCSLDDTGLAVAGYSDGTLGVWPDREGPGSIEVSAHPGGEGVRCCAVPGAGQGILTGGYDGAVRRWSRTAGLLWEAWVGETEQDRISVQACAVDATLRTAVIGLLPGVVQTWDLETATVLTRISAHAGYVSAVAVTPTGTTAVSASVDGTVRLWDPTQPGGAEEEPYAAQPLTVAWNTRGDRVTTIDVYGAVRTWRIDSHEVSPPRTFMTCDWYCSAAAVRPEADLLTVVDPQGTAEVWRLQPEPVRVTSVQIPGAVSCAWGADVLVVGTNGGLLEARDPLTGRRLWSQQLPDGPHVLAVDEGLVVSGGRTGRVFVLDAITGSLHDLTGADAGLGTDGDAIVCAVVTAGCVAVGTTKGRVRCWGPSATNWRPRWDRRGHDGFVLAIAATTSPHALVTTGADGRLCLWPEDGSEPTTIDAHQAPARHAAVGAHGRLAVTAGDDKRALFWSLPDGRNIGELPLHGDGQAAAVHPTKPLATCCDTATGVYVVEWPDR